MTVPTITLNDGNRIPQLGFGVYRVDPTTTEKVVSEALEAGYRHIDTAEMYGNEVGVGRAIARSGIDRSELFVTTKVWPSQDGRHNRAPEMFARSLESLGFDYVDLYLLHWPIMPVPLLRSMWDSFQEFQRAGQARSIGVSNFTARFLGPLLEWADVVPAVNQLELHPAYQQNAAIELGRTRQIAPEAWGPLGQGRVDYANSVVGEIAQAHGKTWAQVLLRWQIDRGQIAIPKSEHAERIRANIDITDFSLSPQELEAINSLDDPSFPAINPDNYA